MGKVFNVEEIKLNTSAGGAHQPAEDNFNQDYINAELATLSSLAESLERLRRKMHGKEPKVIERGGLMGRRLFMLLLIPGWEDKLSASRSLVDYARKFANPPYIY